MCCDVKWMGKAGAGVGDVMEDRMFETQKQYTVCLYLEKRVPRFEGKAGKQAANRIGQL